MMPSLTQQINRQRSSMPHLSVPSPKFPALAALLLLLAALLLSACGSSGSSSTTTSSSASASTSAPGPARFAKVRECLKKHGITLPPIRPGGGPYGPPGVLRKTTGPRLPKGMTRAQYEAAIKKCGGGSFGRRRFFGGAARLKNPAFRKGLARFSACMRSNGVNLPPPNTSGTGPIFNIKTINTASAKFKAAERKCSRELRTVRPGAPGTPPSGTPPAEAPPAGG
jgi:hypothetical protein